VNSQRVFLLRALAVVPDKERALLVLREIAAQPVEGIAEIMHMDSATVRRKLVGARRRLLTSMSAVAEKQGA
jgi:DNA-directed RNA polymerase specialized sigma24 family protein